MNSRDLIMVMSSLLSMAAGVFLPQVAETLAAMPRLILIFMLYMSFLAVGMEALVREVRHMTGTVCLLIALRLLVLPLLCLALFRLLMPQFALGALLLGAAPVGVMAAVFSLMVGANTAMIDHLTRKPPKGGARQGVPLRTSPLRYLSVRAMRTFSGTRPLMSAPWLAAALTMVELMNSHW